MDLTLLKEKCIEISYCFYQERIQEGLGMLENVLGMVLQVPAFCDVINPLLEAVEKKDYVLVADIFYHEMAMQIG